VVVLSFSDEIRLGFYSGQHLGQQNEQSKADWPGRNDQSVRRLLENYHNDPEIIEHRAANGKRRKTPAGWSGEGQAVLCVQTAKKHPFSLTQNQPPKTGKVAA
jgi:hypothetical protein